MANGPLQQIAQGIGRGAVSVLSGIPQIELDRQQASNELTQAQGDLTRAQTGTIRASAEAQAQELQTNQKVSDLLRQSQDPNISAQERTQLTNEAVVLAPELVEGFFEAGGIVDQATKNKIADRAFTVSQQPTTQLRREELQRQIVEGRARGDDMRHSEQLLAQPDDIFEEGLALAQVAALSPEQRVNQQGKGGFTLSPDQIRFNAQGQPMAVGLEKQQGETNQQQVDKLRGVVNNQLADFRKVEGAFERINSIQATPSAAGDLALIFNFMKMLDPGSTVREGEFATAQNATGVDDRVRNTFNRLLTGERLGDVQRNDFISQANNLFTGQRQAADTIVGNVLQQADQDNVSRERVLGKQRLKDFETRKQATPTTPVAQPTVINFSDLPQ